MKQFLSLAFAWFVVTYSGHVVAGPFQLISDCHDIAILLNAQDATISRICQQR